MPETITIRPKQAHNQGFIKMIRPKQLQLDAKDQRFSKTMPNTVPNDQLDQRLTILLSDNTKELSKSKPITLPFRHRT